MQGRPGRHQGGQALDCWRSGEEVALDTRAHIQVPGLSPHSLASSLACC